DTELYHRYGPTETTMCVTSWKCQRKSHNPVVPIGRPITNIQVYILSNTMQPVPIGVPGEIYIGGEGLARGYLHQPDITAERFVPDPFNQEAGRRLFKTADLARYRSDGAIEFLGRSDHQVKIRGFRIELGEIEATLWEHPNVKDAVVLVKEDTAGDKRLIAYVAPRHERTLNQSELRDFARDRLPEYMVPGSWLFLEALPLLPNGKIDRRALPDPDWQQFATEQGYVAPRTPLEMRLAKIWEGVLGRERIGILDNFFDIGGHSLRATQVIARLQQVEQIPLPLSSLFATPTIEGLANSVIRYKQKNGHGEAVAPITLHVQEQEQILPFDQSRIEQLSDEQVTTLLHEMLGQGGHLHE
ncbi:MAG: AMP-binding protein, partial [Ktedonobacteraceae bacterium]|nr:AMP-binding protein [Ktedonobacteraceae bacterium]